VCGCRTGDQILISFALEHVTIKIPTRISSDIDGYSRLLNLYLQIKHLENCKIIFDFNDTSWFEANLAAIFGVLIDYARNRKNEVVLKGMWSSVQNILSRNGFLSEYGMQKVVDLKGTTIPYRKFDPEQGTRFSQYIKEELLAKPDFPSLSRLLSKKINESIYELFENARTHGECDFIYTCGQYYPNKRPARIDMTIVDLGISIKKNVNRFMKSHGRTSMSGPETISWAIKKGNTTKTGNISGGLGLDLVLEFLRLNNGKIQIISSDGYWEYRRGQIETKILNEVFNGTIVNIEFNLDDQSYYQLKSEITLDNIF
jgi:anti-anti-sigma regulatory factor